MDKVCEVGPKTSEIIFKELKNFSRHEMFLVISRCRKSFTDVNTKTRYFMQLFWTFVCVPAWPRFFLYVSGIWVNTFLNLFRLNFIILPIWFFTTCWSKVQNKSRKYLQNLNNCHNCFFMLCSNKNSCFGFV